ncbi:hypothetical protein BDY19DRAFT_977892 [Irpex rosettiformis]|uniref:Uncharacterized protein n=1 Tax=Irpex rosettiformis TaxID=378272 RepID=A0ACB8TNB8_9APHY|nr:hypothetical protein BDY19DRAFT_977892 [Irpex rosettiformis]
MLLWSATCRSTFTVSARPSILLVVAWSKMVHYACSDLITARPWVGFQYRSTKNVIPSCRP